MTEQRLTEQLRLVFTSVEDVQSSAPAGGGAESVVAKREPERPAVTNSLMEAVCERDNLKKALRRVKANKGSPGIDGMTVEQLPDYLRAHWPQHRDEVAARHVHTVAGQTCRDTQARWWRAQTWRAHRSRPVCPAGGAAGLAAASSTRRSPTTATGFGRDGRHIRR